MNNNPRPFVHNDPLFCYVTGTVILLHILALGLCCYSPIKLPSLKNKQRISVQTITLKESIPSKSTSQKISSKPQSKAIPKANPVLPSTSPATPKTTAKTFEKRTRQEILKRAKETLTKALSNTSSVSVKPKPTEAPKFIGALQTESLIPQASFLSENNIESTYQTELIHCLQAQLQMPEYGSIDIELTLNRTGKVVKLVILHEESINNRLYIEKVLPNVHFPHFGNSFSGKSEYTFRIRLSNDI